MDAAGDCCMAITVIQYFIVISTDNLLVIVIEQMSIMAAQKYKHVLNVTSYH